MGDEDRLVLRYYLYQATLSLGFYVPVSVVYLRDRGFSLAFVGLTGATFSFALLLAEVPTGYLADRVGRRWTLVLGNLCRVVGMGGYVVADAGATFLLLKVFFAAGWALRSGTADAYLYELLERRFDADDFARVRGRGTAAQLTASAVAALAGGVLYGVDPALPFVASALLASAGVPLLLTFPETASEETEPFTVGDAARTLRAQVRNPRVGWMVAYTVAVLLVFDLTRTFEQPALRAVGLGAAQLGVLYAAFKLVSAVGGSLVGVLEARVGTRRLFVLFAPLVCVAYAGLLLTPAFLLPVSFLYRFARTLLLPLRNQYLNDRLPDVGRATVLSGASMALSLAGGVARLAASRVAPATGPIRLVGGAGVALAVVAGAVWLVGSPVRSRAPGDARSEAGAVESAPTD